MTQASHTPISNPLITAGGMLSGDSNDSKPRAGPPSMSSQTLVSCIELLVFIVLWALIMQLFLTLQPAEVAVPC